MAGKASNLKWNCSLVAWGMPTDPLTFSGYSKSLASTMAARGLLRKEFSIKQLRATDIFRGAFSPRIKRGRPSLAVKRSWMWSQKTSRLLEQRLWRSIERAGDRGSFLQIGTLVQIDPKFGEYAVLADMTIPQAYRAGQFAVGKMSAAEYEEAVAVQRRVLHGASHAFTLTDWARQSMIDDFELPPEKVTAVYMGSTLAAAPDPAIPKKPRQILFVGIDWKRKGGPQLVEGFRLLRRRISDAELVIVGCSPEVDCPGVKIEGFLHPSDIAARQRLTRLYQESACFTLMSDFEPLGNVMIEAYAMGLPVVAYDSGSRSEIIRHGQTGLLCADRNPQTICDALYRLLSDPDGCQAMGRNARQRIDDDFNWDRVVTRIVEKMSPERSEARAQEVAI